MRMGNGNRDIMKEGRGNIRGSGGGVGLGAYPGCARMALIPGSWCAGMVTTGHGRSAEAK